jgi:hypothetical protein
MRKLSLSSKGASFPSCFFFDSAATSRGFAGVQLS